MNMSKINPIALLREFNLTPKKGLGQSFLIDDNFLRRIVSAAEITRQDAVLEIGAGLGSLTQHLAEAAGQVVTVELDRDFLPVLQKVLGEKSNVQVIQGNILKLDPSILMKKKGYLVVANVPYYITSTLLRHLLEARFKPARLVLTVQREVAQRICALPGKMSRLALSVQVYGNPKPVLKIPASAFYPQPKVNSTTIRIDLYPQPLISENLLDAFFKLINAGFSQKRKMLHNALSKGLCLPHEEVNTLLRLAVINPKRRAQTLTIEEWNQLAGIYEEKYGGLDS